MIRRVALIALLALLFAAAGFAAGQQEGKVTIMYMTEEGDPPSVAVYNEFKADFEAENPNITVQIQQIESGTLSQKITLAIASGAPLDVFTSPVALAPKLGREGKLLNLNGMIDSLGGKGEWYPTTLIELDGKVVAVPYGTGGQVLWYRKDLFDAAGLTVPERWPEWLNATAKLTDKSKGIYGMALPAAKHHSTFMWFSVFLWQSHSQIFNKDLEVILDNPDSVEALDFYIKMLQYVPEGAGQWSYYDILDAYTSGKTAMTMYHGRVLGRLYADAPHLLPVSRVSFLPYNKMMSTWNDLNYNAISAQTKHPDASVAWLRFMNVPENAAKFQLTIPGHLAPVTEAQKRALLASGNEMLSENPEIADQLLNIGKYGYNPILNTGGIVAGPVGKPVATAVVNPYLGVVNQQTVIGEMVQLAFFNKENPAAAVRWADRKIKEIVKEQQE
jgi:multiple sugar transport system substrate-binding protein